MKFNNHLAAIHGYLCSDGYVIRNPSNQKHKYYHIALRNTNAVLLKDFQQRFFTCFGLKPIITRDGRCRIQNKQIYEFLTKEFSFYSYEWKLPRMSKQNLRFWLRAFFDCEGWVENQPAKSRLVAADCCNKKGIFSVKQALQKFGIESNIQKKTGRIIWRLTICGLGNLKRFQRCICFVHPQKKQKLIAAINSYKIYSWKVPENKGELLTFITNKGKLREERNEVRFSSIRKKNLTDLKKVLNTFAIPSRLSGPWRNKQESKYYCLSIKNLTEVFNGRNT